MTLVYRSLRAVAVLAHLTAPVLVVHGAAAMPMIGEDDALRIAPAVDAAAAHHVRFAQVQLVDDDDDNDDDDNLRQNRVGGDDDNDDDNDDNDRDDNDGDDNDGDDD